MDDPATPTAKRPKLSGKDTSPKSIIDTIYDDHVTNKQFYAYCCGEDRHITKHLFDCAACEREQCTVCWPDVTSLLECGVCKECYCRKCEQFIVKKENDSFICGRCNRDMFYASCCEKDVPMLKFFFECRTCEKENCTTCWPEKNEGPKCVKCNNFFCKSCADFGEKDTNVVFICCPCYNYGERKASREKYADDNGDLTDFSSKTGVTNEKAYEKNNHTLRTIYRENKGHDSSDEYATSSPLSSDELENNSEYVLTFICKFDIDRALIGEVDHGRADCLEAAAKTRKVILYKSLYTYLTIKLFSTNFIHNCYHAACNSVILNGHN